MCVDTALKAAPGAAAPEDDKKAAPRQYLKYNLNYTSISVCVVFLICLSMAFE